MLLVRSSVFQVGLGWSLMSDNAAGSHIINVYRSSAWRSLVSHMDSITYIFQNNRLFRSTGCRLVAQQTGSSSVFHSNDTCLSIGPVLIQHLRCAVQTNTASTLLRYSSLTRRLDSSRRLLPFPISKTIGRNRYNLRAYTYSNCSCIHSD